MFPAPLSRTWSSSVLTQLQHVLCLFCALASLPALWPFSFRFYIDGGEVRSMESYAALVRDRDFVEADLLIKDAEGKAEKVLEKFVETTAIINAHAATNHSATNGASASGTLDVALEEDSRDKSSTLRSPRVATARATSHVRIAAARTQAAPVPAAAPSSTTMTSVTPTTAAASIPAASSTATTAQSAAPAAATNQDTVQAQAPDHATKSSKTSALSK
jgi:hypothetical protein